MWKRSALPSPVEIRRAVSSCDQGPEVLAEEVFDLASPGEPSLDLETGEPDRVLIDAGGGGVAGADERRDLEALRPGRRAAEQQAEREEVRPEDERPHWPGREPRGGRTTM
jgi:hypothetical protein